ncbi:MAG: hypothetical protein HQ526_02190 [Actinobacteria bacterium]|nr:hypothetical protein [Actinomycetota bacterium]
MIQTSHTLKTRLGFAAITVALAGVTAACSSGDSTTPSETPNTASAPASQSGPPASSSAAADGWPADAPAPTGMKDLSTTPGLRNYYGKGTVDAVGSQMIDGFTDAGYSIDGGQIINKNSIIVTFSKGSTSITMVVGSRGSDGKVSCNLKLN